MTVRPSTRTAYSRNALLRRWVSRLFLLSIVAYLVVIGFLVKGAATGASRWQPYGVNGPTFMVLIIGSEAVLAITAGWIVKSDTGIWPQAISDGWRSARAGEHLRGLLQLLGGLWNVSLADLRLRTPLARALGRVNRIAALAPLTYALIASAGHDPPLGLRLGALFDIGLTFLVWALMETIMTPHGQESTRGTERVDRDQVSRETTPRVAQSSYHHRRVGPADISRIEELELRCWGGRGATREMVESRLAVFPQGQLGVIHRSLRFGAPRDTLVAWGTIMPANADQVRAFRTWSEATDGGSIRNSDPRGDALVGVNLTSVTEGATFMLVGEVMALVVEWRKSVLVTGARLNGFVAFNAHRESAGRRLFLPDEYARLREIRGYRLNERRSDAGEPPLNDAEYELVVRGIRALNDEPPLDADDHPDYVCSNLRGYLGLPGAEMGKLLPGYFDDPASADWGVLVYWRNPVPRPLRFVSPLNRWLAHRIRNEVRTEWDGRRARVYERARRRSAKQRADAPAEVEAAQTLATP